MNKFFTTRRFQVLTIWIVDKKGRTTPIWIHHPEDAPLSADARDLFETLEAHSEQ